MTPTLDLWPIGNGQVSALIDTAGQFVWGCVPRVDGDPVFLATSNFMLRRTSELNPDLTFRDIKDFRVEKTAA